MADRIHRLKTWPSHFAALKDGRKTFELRYGGDRDFAVGDFLVLDWWDPGAARGSEHCGDDDPLIRRVTHIIDSERYGLATDYVVMSLACVSDDTYCRVLDASPPIACNAPLASDSTGGK